MVMGRGRLKDCRCRRRRCLRVRTTHVDVLHTPELGVLQVGKGVDGHVEIV